jgi:hypothetical protein
MANAAGGLVLRVYLPPHQGRRKQNRSDSKALATFGTTTIQHSTTIGGCHASTKAMGTLAANIAGLKSTFHRQSHRFG